MKLVMLAKKSRMNVTKHLLLLALIIVLSAPQLMFSFSYDAASHAAQKGDWQNAYAIFGSLIVNDPDNAQLLHDAGVAAYKLSNFSQAKACFLRSAELAQDDDLRFDAYFKAGNVCVDDKDLSGALELYDKALKIKPDDKYARHNHDHVAQMLQNENQDKQDKQDKQQNEEKNEERSEEQDKDKSDNEQDKQQQQNEKQGDDKSADESEQQPQGNERNDTENGDDNAQRKKHGDDKQREKKSANNQQRNSEHKLDEKSESAQEDRQKQQSNEHGKAPEKQHETNETTDKNNVASQELQEQGKNDDMHAINDPWLLNILNSQEEQDKLINKQLMEAKVRQHGGKNAQNLW